MYGIKSKREGTLRQRFVRHVRRKLPYEWRERIWWVAPALTLILVSMWITILVAIGGLLIKFQAEGTTLAGWLLVMVSGPVVGISVLWSLPELELEESVYRKAVLFACLAVPGTLLEVLGIWLLADKIFIM